MSLEDDARRLGRPRVARGAVPSADVHLRLAARQYDLAAELARARRESVQDVIRRGLTRLLADERSAPANKAD